jgi:hypothetical protein
MNTTTTRRLLPYRFYIPLFFRSTVYRAALLEGEFRPDLSSYL